MTGFLSVLCAVGIVVIAVLFVPTVQYICYVRSKKKENKKTTGKMIRKYLFPLSLFERHIPYNGPDFVNRAETDILELRNH